MNRQSRRALKKRQKEHVRQMLLPDMLTEIPTQQWPKRVPENLVKVYMSKKYMVQEYKEPKGVIRLSINRTSHNGRAYDENMTWDELQDIKNEIGYSNFDAVELYPKQNDVVNISNMRHLWVMPDAVSFAWRKTRPAEEKGK